MVDLFSGCGGMTLGVAEAARAHGLGLEVRLAVDIDEDAMNVFRDNFKGHDMKPGPVEEWFDGALDAETTETERITRRRVGEVDVLVAGPPCQGHSDLNNHTRRNDPRNALYLRVVRAAQVLRPGVVMVENVPAVLHDRGCAVQSAIVCLRASGYGVAHGVINTAVLGLPQSRRRHVLVAARLPGPKRRDEIVLRAFNDATVKRRCAPRPVRWAIEDLHGIVSDNVRDEPSWASEANRKRMAWLLANDEYDLPNRLRPVCHQKAHSYKSIYGRLDWDAPAQTITTGFTSMGQGRYVHPAAARTLTPHEAARLQGFPDFFRFRLASGRTAMTKLIGNAVPPILTRTLLTPFMHDLEARVLRREERKARRPARRKADSR